MVSAVTPRDMPLTEAQPMRVACSLVLSVSLLSPNGLQSSAQSSQETKEQQPAQKPATTSLKQEKGGGHAVAMTGALMGTDIVFSPAAPLFLFMHGKDITIPKGTEVTAYINGDIPLDQKRFVAQPPVKPEAGDTVQSSGDAA